MFALLNRIVEATRKDIERKQQSITKLFPKFPERLRAVQDNGGIHLESQDPGVWHFYVASGTEKGLEYHLYVKFLNLKKAIKAGVENRRYWNRKKDKVDRSKLARNILDTVDMQILCECPAAQYWGSNFILSKDKYNAKYGKKERRPPNIRNPKQYGAVCKHAHLLFRTLPFYHGTFAKYLNEYYGTDIERYEKAELKKAGKLKKDKEQKSK